MCSNNWRQLGSVVSRISIYKYNCQQQVMVILCTCLGFLCFSFVLKPFDCSAGELGPVRIVQ